MRVRVAAIDWRRVEYAIGIACLTAVTACQSSDDQRVGEPRAVAEIAVVPSYAELTVGETLRLTATLSDRAGNALQARSLSPGISIGESGSALTIADRTGRSGHIVVWSVTPAGVATIDERGLLTPRSEGKATVVAAAGGRESAAEILVNPGEDRPLSVAPGRATISVGDSLALTASPTDLPSDSPREGIDWRGGNPAVAAVSASGVAFGVSSGEATIDATYDDLIGGARLSVLDSPVIHGLDFQGSASVPESVRFEFEHPLPPYPATYVWRAYPRQQPSYYTAFFWGNGEAFYPEGTYYGFHPYPNWNSSAGHFWEIAAPPGRDIVTAENVAYDRWYLQVAVARQQGEARELEFYWDWPDTTKVLRYTSGTHPNPPDPVLVVGDAPWNPGQEVWNGVLRGFQFYDAALTATEIESELTSPGSTRSPWYLNLDPRPDDISDKSGNGNHPGWATVWRPLPWTGIVGSGGAVRTWPPPR